MARHDRALPIAVCSMHALELERGMSGMSNRQRTPSHAHQRGRHRAVLIGSCSNRLAAQQSFVPLHRRHRHDFKLVPAAREGGLKWIHHPYPRWRTAGSQPSVQSVSALIADENKAGSATYL